MSFMMSILIVLYEIPFRLFAPKSFLDDLDGAVHCGDRSSHGVLNVRVDLGERDPAMRM
jgi:hypothetical protein